MKSPAIGVQPKKNARRISSWDASRKKGKQTADLEPPYFTLEHYHRWFEGDISVVEKYGNKTGTSRCAQTEDPNRKG